MMTELDTAGLVVIAGQVLGIGTDAALSQLDIPAGARPHQRGLHL